MKRLTLIVLALLLAGCSAFQPVPPTPQPTPVPPTPQVIIATVIVTVVPTERPTQPPVPTNTPVPTLPPPTVANTEVPATETAAPPAGGALTVPASLYGTAFSNVTLSGDHFSLRCEPKSLAFDVTVSDIYITVMEFYYRIRDKHSTYVPEWSRGANLDSQGGGRFTLTFSGESVTPDNRKANGWFDIQLVGLNKLGQVVGRTEKIVDLVTYTIDCP
ncbi:MAG: hypothetical protein HFACDABA_00598 [Anaerolineales bacterium]|nr:hypothetical protein [Anaerolineales bacterium]